MGLVFRFFAVPLCPFALALAIYLIPSLCLSIFLSPSLSPLPLLLSFSLLYSKKLVIADLITQQVNIEAATIIDDIRDIFYVFDVFGI